MPYISVRTNVEIKDKNALMKRLGEIITVIPGKTEARTMVSLHEKVDLYFAGSDEPCAIAETLVNAGTDHSRDREYLDLVITVLSEELKISEKRIYSLLDEEDMWFSRK